MERLSLGEAVQRLDTFLRSRPLTAATSELEHQLDGADGDEAGRAVAPMGVDRRLLHAAITTRRELGRIIDLIHATAIAMVLPDIL